MPQGTEKQVTELSVFIEAELVDGLSLPQLSEVANRYHAEAETSAHSAVEYAWHAGQALIAAKGQCAHGEWLPWLEANFNGSRQTADNYQKLASNCQHVSNLKPGTSIRGALAAIQKENRASKDELAPSTPAPKRKAITDQARSAGWNLRKAVERIERIAADDRFNAQKEKVAPEIRDHLVNAVEVCQHLIDRINNTTKKED